MRKLPDDSPLPLELLHEEYEAVLKEIESCDRKIDSLMNRELNPQLTLVCLFV